MSERLGREGGISPFQIYFGAHFQSIRYSDSIVIVIQILAGHILTNFYCVPKLSRGHVLRLRAQGKEQSRALRKAESRARQVTGHGTGHFRGKGTGQGTQQGTGQGTGRHRAGTQWVKSAGATFQGEGAASQNGTQ